jgi:uncharacterized RDD family membrane protein YckC
MDNSNKNSKNVTNDKIYAGILIRILSGLIDFLVFVIIQSIVFLILLIVQKIPKNYWIIYELIVPLYYFIYNITIPQYFGGTLGKILLKIKILKTNYQKIGFKESFLRYLFDLLWYLYISIVNIVIVINTPDELYNEFKTFSEWVNYSNSNEPKITIILLIAINIWIFSEYFVLLLNKRKRGLQDYLAGTIIVNEKYYKNII